ncbi:MAG TPA: lysophospholipid acyltransferase family protein [Proteiniphilum sp.]|nr:lysophospholipid acyltransferase family protein [Proteiniphilum sp.]HPJ50901.1 lysophospholipid acyltransferase family protein [Proteiniphilum sp.]HPR20303.1 lysophospholipid acyltransferase family protein [Proteiniphilum sp.]
MKEHKEHIGTRLLVAIASFLALLPFPLLYFLSDLLFQVVYHLARYRRKMVRKNLCNAFPEKSEREIIILEKAYYRHLCDYFVETVKTLQLSEEEMKERMHFENPELLNRLMKDGSSCLVCLGHYGNWEWVPSIRLHLMPGVEAGLVYKQLHSLPFDQLFREIRGRFGSLPIEKRSVLRTLVRKKNEGQTIVVGFLSDQRPPRVSDKYWTTFLNQDTPLQTGMEKIARSLSMSVVYLDIEKRKRGFYRGRFVTLAENASLEEKDSITEAYVRLLEKTVLRAPAFYLWSHNLWKFRKHD